MRATLAAVCVLLANQLAAGEPPRPFVLWNAQDIAAIKGRIANEPWAKAIYEQNLKAPPDFEKDLFDLLRFAVGDDADAGKRQKDKLFRMVRSKPPYGGSQWLNIVRFDLLYAQLTAQERQEVEKLFRDYIEQALFTNAVIDGTEGFNDKARYSRYDKQFYSRSNWLPNIIFPRKLSANLMAAALGDEKLIRRAWSAYGSIQWYIDEYLGDTGFYSEEFSKMGATPGELLLYGRAVERLGLDELGYGYAGRGGASVRGHIESVLKLGYPRIDLCSERPQYPKLTAGDLRRAGSSARGRHPTHAFQHAIVQGYLPGGQGGNNRWSAPGAWGGEIRGDNPQWDGYGGFTPKMQIPLWFELAHQKWPQTRFDYFLAQMRTPDEQKYIPSLYLGLDPIDPAKVAPPPALSYVATQRGIAMLRHDESPAYWTSSAPAVGVRLASPYAHGVNDALAICGYYAHNRPILINRQVTPGYATGWTRSAQSHNSVIVDQREPAATTAFTERHAFFGAVKFLSANTQKVYPGVDQTRALFLTSDYLVDMSRLAAGDGREREYTWLAHALGKEALAAAQYDDRQAMPQWLECFAGGRATDLGPGDWTLRVDQVCALSDPSKAALPKVWYDRRVGATLHVLGAPGTTVWIAPTPLADRPGDAPKPEQRPDEFEVGGVSVIASRKATATTFAAVWAPFADGQGEKPLVIKRISEADDHLALSIQLPGAGPGDVVMIQWGDGRQPVSVPDAQRQMAFVGWAFVRTHDGQVEAYGDLRFIDGPGSRLTLNGRLCAPSVRDGRMAYGAVPSTAPATTQSGR
jgi:hypothetical protein